MHMLSAQVVACVGQSCAPSIVDDIEILDTSPDVSTRQCVLNYCLDAMRLCIKRYVNFYKPYYRLAWAYVNVADIRVCDFCASIVDIFIQDYKIAENILTGDGSRAQLAIGLFTGRKPTTNIFEVFLSARKIVHLLNRVFGNCHLKTLNDTAR